MIMSEQSVSKPKVLFVEDCSDFQRLLSRRLTMAGFEPTLEPNGQAALQRLVKTNGNPSHFDLILTDCHMPLMDGIEMTRALREQGCTIPIIMCTSATDPSTMMEAIEAGCNSLIYKSLTQEEIVKHILLWAGDSIS